MEDPQNSGRLSDGGVRLTNGGNGDTPPRRRSRKGRTKAAAAVPAHGGGAQAPQPRDVPASAGDAPVGKRRKKRRRGKRRHGGNGDAPQQAVKADAAENQQTSAPSHKRRRRRKGHARGPLGADGCKRVETAQQTADAHQAPPARAPGGEARPADTTTREPSHKTSSPDAGGAHRGRHHGERHPDHRLYAALDLGTNNCRLLIAQPTRSHQFRVVDGFSRIVRLGEGLAATGSLSPDAMDRAIEALSLCAAKLKGRAVRRMRLIATEACRAADNGEAFLTRVREETGLELEIINRETEARLAVSSCASLIGRETRAAVLFDIGGGSSEIAVIRLDGQRSQRLANHISHWTSLPVGVVTLSERYGGHDVTPEVFETMVREVEALLGDFHCPEIECGDARDGFHLIGTSGTVTTLAGVHLDLPRYDRRKVDGIWLSDDEVSAMQAKLLSWDFAGRAANPCIGPDRADLVLAGCAILEAIRRRWPAPRMRVADRGLREGILTDMMMRDGVWRRPRRRNGFNRQNHSD
ncbi:Ppx/GppA phosphatase family protein [Martelella endophytica]|uniref:Exopolyphosphatase n=1 Tax=Martelella endophytica TaxID=1486262 RepID=A0A0D5LUW4_MAREN|nr:Ppx/GppA phosphatase family protein [Martelella endophytica]AJY48044.1 exopolyphosphatase [Martelella endophytica]